MFDILKSTGTLEYSRCTELMAGVRGGGQNGAFVQGLALSRASRLKNYIEKYFVWRSCKIKFITISVFYTILVNFQK